MYSSLSFRDPLRDARLLAGSGCNNLARSRYIPQSIGSNRLDASSSEDNGCRSFHSGARLKHRRRKNLCSRGAVVVPHGSNGVVCFEALSLPPLVLLTVTHDGRVKIGKALLLEMKLLIEQPRGFHCF